MNTKTIIIAIHSEQIQLIKMPAQPLRRSLRRHSTVLTDVENRPTKDAIDGINRISKDTKRRRFSARERPIWKDNIPSCTDSSIFKILVPYQAQNNATDSLVSDPLIDMTAFDVKIAVNRRRSLRLLNKQHENSKCFEKHGDNSTLSLEKARQNQNSEIPEVKLDFEDKPKKRFRKLSISQSCEIKESLNVQGPTIRKPKENLKSDEFKDDKSRAVLKRVRNSCVLNNADEMTIDIEEQPRKKHKSELNEVVQNVEAYNLDKSNVNLMSHVECDAEIPKKANWFDNPDVLIEKLNMELKCDNNSTIIQKKARTSRFNNPKEMVKDVEGKSKKTHKKLRENEANEIDKVKEYYLDKNIQKNVRSLETIFEECLTLDEPKRTKKVRRLIPFSEIKEKKAKIADECLKKMTHRRRKTVDNALRIIKDVTFCNSMSV